MCLASLHCIIVLSNYVLVIRTISGLFIKHLLLIKYLPGEGCALIEKELYLLLITL